MFSVLRETANRALLSLQAVIEKLEPRSQLWAEHLAADLGLSILRDICFEEILGSV